MTALPILKIETAHSRYVIDQNEGKFKRTPVHKDANDLSYGGVLAGEWQDYGEILAEPTVGGRLAIFLPDGQLLRSTEVQSIEEVHESVRA